MAGKSFITTVLLPIFILLGPNTQTYCHMAPLPSSEGCRPSNANVDGFREGSTVVGLGQVENMRVDPQST